jgi:predicted transposase YdaD
MPKPFDATLKELVEAYPADWLGFLGLPATGPVEVLSAELSTVTAAADTLLRVGNAVIHIDVESGPDPALATRMLLYNVLAHRHTGLPVHSVVVLLRPNANAGNLTDRVEYAVNPARSELRFRYEVIRLWETPTDVLLRTGLGLLPLAVLGHPPGGVRKRALPALIEAVVTRIDRDASPDRAAQLVTAAYILSGMYLTKEEAKRLFREVQVVHESSTYQAILDEGEEIGTLKQARKLLRLQGVEKFGPPTDAQQRKLDTIADVDRLDRLAVRLLKVDSWDALLRGR